MKRIKMEQIKGRTFQEGFSFGFWIGGAVVIAAWNVSSVLDMLAA